MTTTTYTTQDGNKTIQRTIEFVGMDIDPAGDLIGKVATFYPNKRIGSLMGKIVAVWDEHYTVEVTTGETSRGMKESGKKWLVSKQACGISYL